MKHAKLVIIGAGGHGKVIADIAKHTYKSIVFLDDYSTAPCCGYPVVGITENFGDYLSTCDFFVAVGNCQTRAHIMEGLIDKNAYLATLIHPNAVVAEGVSIGVGSVVMAGAVINPEAIIGKGCIINTASSVDHDCRIQDYTHISVGAHIAGSVSVGMATMIGAGATVINNLTIGDRCVVGAGAVVVENLLESGVYIGVPAKLLKNKVFG